MSRTALSVAVAVAASLACGGGGPPPPAAPPIDRGCELKAWVEPKKEERDVPVRATPEQKAPRTGELPADVDMVQVVIDEIRGRFAHYTSVKVTGKSKATYPGNGWIPLARVDLEGQWAQAEDGRTFAPRVFEAPTLGSAVVATHDQPCGAVTQCGFAVEEVLGCAGSWARVVTAHGSKGWLHADFQCDNRLTTCASKVAKEVPDYLEPAE